MKKLKILKQEYKLSCLEEIKIIIIIDILDNYSEKRVYVEHSLSLFFLFFLKKESIF
jgi:hypothetical protein